MVKYLSVICILFLLLCNACSMHNLVKENDDIQKIYDSTGLEASFGLLNNINGNLTITNQEMFSERYCPASTFKIFNSLVALQTGKIANDTVAIPWDKVIRNNTDWNKDLNLQQAFKASSVPFYQELARRIGRDTMQYWIDSLSYGNKNITGPIDSFWLNDNLKISCDEQLAFVKRFYFGQIPFRESVINKVKTAMLHEVHDSTYNLSYKTGWFQQAGKPSLGWIVGYVEKQRQPYFFVQLLKSKDPYYEFKNSNSDIRKELLKKVLKKLDVIPN